ncbi:hypothetical protein BV22DRAFT_475712 [Leucogyrophana mollusca]|uniref:Uncharacterized protein n=1 Tax=Leucogyrophana mollusca TaxID=85980 RepID=A0ACB8BGD6_9AGAM|nr:hypothetical protein BV22DRAFT_475712 [Leucogyrophana mollusca]
MTSERSPHWLQSSIVSSLTQCGLRVTVMTSCTLTDRFVLSATITAQLDITTWGQIVAPPWGLYRAPPQETLKCLLPELWFPMRGTCSDPMPRKLR